MVKAVRKISRGERKRTILLVDDHLLFRAGLRKVFDQTEYGSSVFLEAGNGKEAVDIALREEVDLIFLDESMPELSGFEVCKAFKSEPALAEVPIIFITSHESAQLEAKGLELGAADFISKPPHAPLVLARVHTYQRLKLLSDTMRSAVKMDFLTGAVTRRSLEKSLTQEWLRAQRSGAPLTLLLADIEGFTAYNAEFGEEKGDACLKSVADALRAAAHRPMDVLGRYAGGKFAILMPETDAQGASIVAQRAIDAVDSMQILHAALMGRGRVTLCVGGGCRDSSHPSTSKAAAGAVPNDLIMTAEQALKSGRSAGGHRARILDIAEFENRQ